jgi:ribonuclease HII
MLNKIMCGIDEAGRGPLAGKVYAAAVILDTSKPILGLADSKTLSPEKRENLYLEITAKALAYSIAYADVHEIDNINILQATLLAMQRAFNGLAVIPNLVLIDGTHKPQLDENIEMETIIKGDSIVAEISAASILAKVARDREMIELDKVYPEYGFAKHKGYGTKEHIEALKKYGALSIHRRSFNPVSQYIRL